MLRALADLAPSGEQRATRLAVPTEWFRWVEAGAVRVFTPGPFDDGARSRAVEAAMRVAGPPDDLAARSVGIDRSFGERLAAVDQVRPEQRSLRMGWLFVAGRAAGEDGRPRRVFHPLVTVPVRAVRPPALGSARLVPAGDVEISELVDDWDERSRLEAHLQLGGGALDGMRDVTIPAALLARLDGLQRFARATASAARLPASRVVPAGDGPEKLMRSEGLVIVAGVGVFATHDTGTASRAGSLRAWAAGPLPRWTAFHSLYVDARPPPDLGPAQGSLGPATVESPYLLTPAQREAVVRSRHEPVTLISGGPGTGKSHTVVAIACDALARGESVLVTAKTDATVDALLDLLERSPGPEPVVFGSNERREALAARLAGGRLQPVADDALAAAREAHRTARAAEAAATAAVVDRLSAERALSEGGGAEEDESRRLVPRLFDPSADLARAAQLLDAVSGGSGRGWWSRRRQRRRSRELHELAGCPEGTPPGDVATALRTARATRIASGLVAAGGLELGEAWTELRGLGDAAREATARWLSAEARSGARMNRSTMPAVAALATALRSGRAARRHQLSRLDDEKLTRALPLWVGSLPDIDDLLPPLAGAFDLVIVDEASSIDQPLAVPALLRARRAVIAGDPNQLRHVSFLSDQRLREVVELHGLADRPLVAARLDVRRNSTFDVAAAVAPVLVLDEHFRSVPHLVEFVANHLYGGGLKVATRKPSTEGRDCVHVVRLAGERDKAGVVAAEVDWAVAEVARLRSDGAASVGIITPFRAQADALEAAVLARFSADDIAALGLRVGTVHAFQGNERDVVIASIGVGPDQSGASWRFVEDPHLFAVFVTRARRHLTLVMSAEPPPGGLLAGYVARADRPPGPPPPAGETTAWAAQIAGDLRLGGVDARTGYPTGRHVVDVCAPPGDTAVECGVHPSGPAAHVDRHLALVRSGWHVLEAFPSRWSQRRGELVVSLLDRLGVQDIRRS